MKENYIMTRNNLAKFDQFFNEIANDMARSVIGFDRVFDGFRSAIGTYDSYPPYNVEKVSDNKYRVIIALAGFKKENIEIIKVENWLKISGSVDEDTKDTETTFLYQGIAQRAFERKVQLAEDIEVTGASMSDGLLAITLTRATPKEKQPKTIKIK